MAVRRVSGKMILVNQGCRVAARRASETSRVSGSHMMATLPSSEYSSQKLHRDRNKGIWNKELARARVRKTQSFYLHGQGVRHGRHYSLHPKEDEDCRLRPRFRRSINRLHDRTGCNPFFRSDGDSEDSARSGRCLGCQSSGTSSR